MAASISPRCSRHSRRRNYRGWLVVEAEQDPAKAPPLAYARLGFAHLSAAAARAGL
jgi:inosose dehydratase